MKSRKLQFLALVVLMSLFSWTTVHAQITPLGDSYPIALSPPPTMGLTPCSMSMALLRPPTSSSI